MFEVERVKVTESGFMPAKPNGNGRTGQIRVASWFWLGKSITIGNVSLNKGSLIDFLNTVAKLEKKLEKGTWFLGLWFTWFGGASDEEVLEVFNRYKKISTGLLNAPAKNTDIEDDWPEEDNPIKGLLTGKKSTTDNVMVQKQAPNQSVFVAPAEAVAATTPPPKPESSKASTKEDAVTIQAKAPATPAKVVTAPATTTPSPLKKQESKVSLMTKDPSFAEKIMISGGGILNRPLESENL